MERMVQLEILTRLIDLLERGSTDVEGASDSLIPVDEYTSAEWLADEQRALFRKLPLVVGHASEIPAPGNYLTHDASGIPLLVVRQADGAARAFLNVCRHRGTKLVGEPCGHAKAFV